MKKTKIFLLLVVIFFSLGLMSCNKNDVDKNDDVNDQENNENNDNNSNGENNENNGSTNDGNQSSTDPTTPEDITIFLAGDSTVKTYDEDQFIGGWGQYLDLFVDDNITVVNCAQGGRSSRSFINEGRLYNIEGNNYSFDQNGGKSIEDSIEAGDYLFIQFGHNDDDTKKASSYSTLYDRMTPLGVADQDGVYPTTEGQRVPTTSLPTEFTQNVSQAVADSALNEIQKYGSTYYSYDCGGTYKWYLKQYIDFAREKDAIPVLVTPVSRVKFDANGTIIGGAGLHGENFAYVQAVRQLASEEDCLLIDLFQETKNMLEVATPTYANYLMALKPNDLVGEWPLTYDTTYGEASLGYTGIEATHYNKYGAYLTCALLVEEILQSDESKNAGKESFAFKDSLNTSPSSYIDPSNLMSKSIVNSLEALCEVVEPSNPNRVYPLANDVVTKINSIQALGEVTNDNYLEIQVLCQEARKAYNSLNIDDRSLVTNIQTLEQIEAKVDECIAQNAPKPVQVIELNPSDLVSNTYTQNIESSIFTIAASAGKNVEIKDNSYNFTYNLNEYSTTKYIKLGGTADTTGRFIQFTTTGACRITVAAKSSGTADRVLKLVDSNNTQVATFDAKSSTGITTVDVDAASTFKLSSTSGGVYIYYIIIEYFQ